MPDVFTPPKSPSANSLKNRQEATVNRLTFEGNYSQRSGTGPNPWSGQVTLRFNQLTLMQLDEIIDFIKPKAGRVAFLYQLPGVSVAELWTCPSVETGIERNKTHWAATLQLTRENDLNA